MEPLTSSPDRPQVSAILANYDAAPYLEAAVRTILAQRGVTVEVVIVDDGSRDDGPAIAARLAGEDARVRVARTPRNGGPAAARNLGLAMATGEWVAIVDSDDLIHPARFATLIAAADAVGADMVADDLLVFTQGSAAAPVRFLAPSDRAGGTFLLDLGDYLRRSVLYGRDPNPGFLKPMIRRAALNGSGVRYDEGLRIAEDDDLVIRLLLAGLRYAVVPQPLYFYRKHGASISHRMTLAAITAIAAADAALGPAVVRQRPDLAPAVRLRARAFARGVAFERALAAVRARRPVAALAILAARPGAWPLLRMPLGGLARRLLPRRRAEAITAGDPLPALVALADAA